MRMGSFKFQLPGYYLSFIGLIDAMDKNLGLLGLLSL